MLPRTCFITAPRSVSSLPSSRVSRTMMSAAGCLKSAARSAHRLVPADIAAAAGSISCCACGCIGSLSYRARANKPAAVAAAYRVLSIYVPSRSSSMLFRRFSPTSVPACSGILPQNSSFPRNYTIPLGGRVRLFSISCRLDTVVIHTSSITALVQLCGSASNLFHLAGPLRTVSAELTLTPVSASIERQVSSMSCSTVLDDVTVKRNLFASSPPRWTHAPVVGIPSPRVI